MGLPKNNADAASIACMSDMTVMLLKSQIAIPFFLKGVSPVCVVVT